MKEIYAALSQRIISQVEELERVDFYLKQDRKPGEIVASPSAYIQFLPIRWEKHGHHIQKGDLRYRVHLMSLTSFGDENDIIDETHIDHIAVERKIYTALNGFSAGIQYLIPETLDEDNFQILDVSDRKIQTVHDDQSRLIHTYQEFESRVYDNSALPECQSILAELDLMVMMAPNLDA